MAMLFLIGGYWAANYIGNVYREAHEPPEIQRERYLRRQAEIENDKRCFEHGCILLLIIFGLLVFSGVCIRLVERYQGIENRQIQFL